MTLSIPAEPKDFVEQSVASGRYRSELEVVINALRLLRHRETKWDVLRDDVQAGIEDLDNGDKTLLDIEDIKRRGSQALMQLKSGL